MKRIEDFPQVAGAIGEARKSLGLAANRRIKHWSGMDEKRKAHYLSRAGLDINDSRDWDQLSDSTRYQIEQEIIRVLKLAKSDAEMMGVA
ncbi:MAG: hypothetical protein KZQ94_20965 [Candidatus Thiodiazotropha sp. (ex Troendleina suluensis)]|nr:hypothetical protein [Candidatus Thiodiazotropha sp. (ex Troendleina suluensis)]